jgi:hypothetical protein
MAITKLPPAPTPTDTTTEFNAKSFAFVAALDGFVAEANALGLGADTAAKSAATDAAAALVASDAAVGAANFKGEWGLLTGELGIPASVSHQNKVWILKLPVSNVSEEVPGVSLKWLSTTDLSAPGPIGALTPDVGHFKTLRATGSESDLSVRLPNIKEVIAISAAGAAGALAFDLTSQSIRYFTTNATADWELNFRGSSVASLDSLMAPGEVVSATFISTQGATAFLNRIVKIDGVPIFPKWIGGPPRAGNPNGLDSYSFSIIKTAALSFTVLASITQFK